MYLCNVISNNKFNQKIKKMDKELEERIERKKKMLADFLELSERLGMKTKERE